MDDIPHMFCSFETDEPFKECCDCGCELLESAQMYMVQKVYQGSECIMEYALCIHCKETLEKQISQQSMETLFDFLHDNAKPTEAQDSLTAEESIAQIESCLTCGRMRTECDEYSYSGLFVGATLIPGPMPMMVCGHCQEAIAENLSEHTKDVKDQFYEKNFPGPPSKIELSPKRRPTTIL